MFADPLVMDRHTVALVTATVGVTCIDTELATCTGAKGTCPCIPLRRAPGATVE